MPALLTRMSSRPNAPTAAATTASAPAAVGDVVGVCQRRAPGRGDLVHDVGRRPGVGTRPVHGTAEVVDHDRGAAGREQQGVGPPDAPPRAGDDGDPAVEAVLARLRVSS